MTPKQGLAFVKRHGIVLQAARGPVPNLAETIVGAPIRGSWWGHERGKEIYRVADAISKSGEVLVCRAVEGKVTFVHRRLWPALVKLADRLPKERLAKIWEEHTETGAHRSKAVQFPHWVPEEVLKEAQGLASTDAEALLGSLISTRGSRGQDKRRRDKSRAVRGSSPSGRHVARAPRRSAANWS